MMLPELKYNFHDGYLKSFELGPRREVRLLFVLPRPIGTRQESLVVQVRFGAIENYGDVQSFFSSACPSCTERLLG